MVTVSKALGLDGYSKEKIEYAVHFLRLLKGLKKFATINWL